MAFVGAEKFSEFYITYLKYYGGPKSSQGTNWLTANSEETPGRYSEIVVLIINLINEISLNYV